ncbi:hypothetical protein KVR01_010640 [Diaporthe batatas]|uniref:uncharacterized protein n=1 Tax=Diaporthe batatas TaxID=748121 RepID=UPI001D05B998|nr:uncharacterized protein KVR01_010640 [Diaporthe batatas]KAG8160003.1 hypothetical protein KVR01_010640 [Diaporthe batatas]
MGQVLGKVAVPVQEEKVKEPEGPNFPDYMLDSNAVTYDKATWRYGGPPDYRVTRQMWANEKRANHGAKSLETLVENLVKNWEIEASHKMDVSEWRTVDPDKYTFSINGGPPQDAEHMLKVGTYSAVIAPNKYYGANSTFDESHKTFRDMMPNFAWEVLEVYSGPPVVAFKWRHWGWMKGDYVGKNEEGSTVTIKAHRGILDIQGVTVAKLNDKFQVTSLETWFDPTDMFKQMRPSDETMTTRRMECPMGYTSDMKGMGSRGVGH